MGARRSPRSARQDRGERPAARRSRIPETKHVVDHAHPRERRAARSARISPRPSRALRRNPRREPLRCDAALHRNPRSEPLRCDAARSASGQVSGHAEQGRTTISAKRPAGSRGEPRRATLADPRDETRGRRRASSRKTSRSKCSHLPSALTALRRDRSKRAASLRCREERERSGLGSRAARMRRGAPRSARQDRGERLITRRSRILDTKHVVDHAHRRER
jgi:hypothetical protein